MKALAMVESIEPFYIILIPRYRSAVGRDDLDRPSVWCSQYGTSTRHVLGPTVIMTSSISCLLLSDAATSLSNDHEIDDVIIT